MYYKLYKKLITMSLCQLPAHTFRREKYFNENLSRETYSNKLCSISYIDSAADKIQRMKTIKNGRVPKNQK